MGTPKTGLNPTTHSVGFTAKLVTVRSVSPDGLTAVCVDRQNTQTQVPMLVQRSKGPLPAPGDTWLLTQDLGMWTFAAFVATSAAQFGAAASGSAQLVIISPAPPASPTPGQVWMNESAGNEILQWNGTAWVQFPLGTAAIADGAITPAKIQPGSITSAQLSPSAGITPQQVSFSPGTRIINSTSQPQSPQTGDLWMNPDDGNAFRVWNGGTWSLLQFGADAIAPASLTAAQLAASAGITAAQVNFSYRDLGGLAATIAAEAPANPAIGDLWYDATTGYALKSWNGTAWLPYQFGTNAIAAGSITAELIAADTITARQIASGTVVAGIVDGTTISAATFEGTNWIENPNGSFLYSGTPAAGNLVASVSPFTGVDSFGNNYIHGLVSYTPGPSTVQAVQIYNSQAVFWAASVGMTSTSPVWWQQSGNIQGIVSLEETGVNGTEDGLHFGVTNSSTLWLDNLVICQGVLSAVHPGSSPAVAETWQTPSMSVTGITVVTLRYKLYPDNTVRIQFHFTVGSTAAAGTLVMFTLPTGYRPTTDYRGAAPGIYSNAGSYSNATYNGRFNVTTGGIVQILGFPGGAVGSGGITECDGYYVVPLD